jgi:hypothetical protein
MSNQATALKAVLSGGTVSFHAIFAKAFRSIPAGVFLSQGYFWQENAKYRNKDKYKTVEGKTFFTMTAKEWFDETSLTQEQQTKVREILTKHKVLVEWLTDNPARLFFHIDLDALVSVINQYIESGISVSVDNRTKNRFKTQPSLGKKRKQDLVKNPTSYNEESNESLESEREVEHTPAPAESDNLKAEEVNRGLVAPPAEAAAPPEDDKDAFAEWLPSLHKAQERNAPGVMPIPTHTVTTIDPAEPGLKVVNPFAMPRRVETVDEAEEIIMEWAKGDGRESVRKWYADAARQCTAVDVTAMVAKFAGVYLTIGDEGKRQRMAQDPLQFFKYTFKSFLKTEKSFSAKVMPGASAQSNSPVPSNIRRL